MPGHLGLHSLESKEAGGGSRPLTGSLSIHSGKERVVWKLRPGLRARLEVHNINERQDLSQNLRLSIPSSTDVLFFPKSLW